MDKKEYSIVTEVGVFGELNINDPTVKKVKTKNNGDLTEDELNGIINESIQNNANTLIH